MRGHNLDFGNEAQMTAEMAFECVLVSRDPSVLCAMNKVLEKFSISTKVCFTSSKAADRLLESTADLVIVDCEDSAAELMETIHKCAPGQKPTVVAVSDQPVAGAHIILRKPLTGESCTESLTVAFRRMMTDHRRHARYAVMGCVTAENKNHRSVPLTVMDIGEGGLGLMTREVLAIGEILSFRLLLPGIQRSIYIEARVLWTRQYGAAGCEFVRIPPVDREILSEWLQRKCKVKQPLVEL